MITILDSQRGEVVHIQADEEGRFKVPLITGIYTLVPEPLGGLIRSPEYIVQVEEGRKTEVILMYDSGIR